MSSSASFYSSWETCLPHRLSVQWLVLVARLLPIQITDTCFTQLFQSLITVSNPPSVISSAHLHLAQLSDDPRSALNHYQKAVDILYEQLKSKNNAQEATQDKQTIAKALVAMTEIWMSDLWWASSILNYFSLMF